MSEKFKILAVDDNEEFCQNVTDILGLRSYEVVSAYNGFKALELVRQDNFALVLMDVKMPVVDGVEIFKKLKEIAPDIPVIMVSAYTVEDLIIEALREGAFGFLKKPLDFEKLFGLIEYATGKGVMILVADDDKALCANLKDALSDKGYRVSIAYDGETAVQASRENNFDIMLIDMKMPVLNGLETYLVIRDIRPDVVAIIITGYRQEVGDLVQHALQESVYTCLEKPIDMENLLSLLKQIKEQKDKGTLKKLQ
jgi:two-component system response regulator HydG